MNLFKIGDMTLNMDRVNGIQDRQPSADPNAPPGHLVIRILFDDATIELGGTDAQVLRRWIRHNARNLAPQRGEDGEELIGPEEQLRRVGDELLAAVDRQRPRDSAVRAAARRLNDMLDSYVTGQLLSVSRKPFERDLGVASEEAATP